MKSLPCAPLLWPPEQTRQPEHRSNPSALTGHLHPSTPPSPTRTFSTWVGAGAGGARLSRGTGQRAGIPHAGSRTGRSAAPICAGLALLLVQLLQKSRGKMFSSLHLFHNASTHGENICTDARLPDASKEV